MTTPPEDPKEDPREKLRRLLASEDETRPELPIPDEKPGGSPSDETIASVISSLDKEQEEDEPKIAEETFIFPEHTPTPDTPVPALDKDHMPLPRRFSRRIQ